MSSVQQNWTRRILKHSQPDTDGWERCAGLDKTEAETLMDWLEANGYGRREVSYQESEGFTVRWSR